MSDAPRIPIIVVNGARLSDEHAARLVDLVERAVPSVRSESDPDVAAVVALRDAFRPVPMPFDPRPERGRIPIRDAPDEVELAWAAYDRSRRG